MNRNPTAQLDEPMPAAAWFDLRRKLPAETLGWGLLPREASALLGVPAHTIRRRCKRGEVPGAEYSPNARRWVIPNQPWALSAVAPSRKYNRQHTTTKDASP